MKKIILFIIIILPVFYLISCNNKTKNANEKIKKAKLIIPRVENKDSEIAKKASEDDFVNNLNRKPRIPLDSKERVLEVLNVNLDLDLTDEQVVVAKNNGGSNRHIRLLVIDYDPIRNIYFKSWEAETNAVNTHDFTLSIKDIVGDHNLEIILHGTNENGEITLNVFRKTPSPNGLGLYFVNICSILSNGIIDIQEKERSESYQLGQKNGMSFPIVVYNHDPESKNVMDLVKLTYYWKYPKNHYVLSSTIKIPGQKIEEKRLEKLFTSGNIKTFEDFLSGPWYYTKSGKNAEIISFSPDKRKISLYSKSVDENYIWLKSYSSIYNRLRILAENESISAIKKSISVRVRSINEIDVSIQGTDRWDFTSKRYIRLPAELQKKLLVLNDNPGIILFPLHLSGVYRNATLKQEIIFKLPHFNWIDNKKKLSGGYTVYTINGKIPEHILEMVILDTDGIVKDKKAFLINYKEEKEKEQITRFLTLTPVTIYIGGIRDISDKSIRLKQIEYLSKTH
ncbi:MAG: hypothetical protein DRP57_10590 [Spirochaetes bacterium]|nr:MAG: hypothetical protein DRP57_10590 [Spirochaetota bacterium]